MFNFIFNFFLGCVGIIYFFFINKEVGLRGLYRLIFGLFIKLILIISIFFVRGIGLFGGFKNE